jgi:tetratricopeptide (TPR) repeat protein
VSCARRIFALLCGAMLGLGCAEGSSTVTRMAGGVRYEGRFVNPEAYAAYLQGALHEAQGDYKNALSSYLEAHAEDPDSPEVWARIGAVQCVTASPESGPKAARVSFQRGVHNDPSYYGNYLERARCAERAHALPAALVDATAAVARRPQDEAANLLVIRVLGALGRNNEARTWLQAFQTYRASSAALRRELPAPREGSDATARLAAHSAAFAELGAGHAERARSQAQLELAADSSNADAWIAALVACDALRDAQCFETALTSLKAPSLPASETALRFLRELIARRTGASVTF